MTTKYEQLKALVLENCNCEPGSRSDWVNEIAKLEATEPSTTDKLRRVEAELREDRGNERDLEMGEALAKVFDAVAEKWRLGHPIDEVAGAVIEAGELMYEQILEAEK